MRAQRSPAGLRRPARRSKQKCCEAHLPPFMFIIPKGEPMSMTGADWRSGLDHLAPKQAELLLGTSLSRRFVSLPMWLNHPANVAGFYGILIAMALLLPYRVSYGDAIWWPTWIFHASLLIAACMLLGFASLIIARFSKRPPVAPPRTVLYAMPFVGLTVLGANITELLTLPAALVWFLLLLPGPLYVHLSWAPRWRMLCRLEDGLDPFEDVGIEPVETETDMEAIVEEDDDLKDVLDTILSEEE